MLKVFYFTNKPPFPPKDGGCIAMASILRSLLSSKKVEVFHFTLATYKHPFRKDLYPDTWKSKMTMDSQFIKTKTNLWGATTHLLRNKSYNISRFEDVEVKKKIKEYLDGVSFDIAIFESVFLLPYIQIFKDKGIKVVVRTHNVEHNIWQMMAENIRFPIKKWYYRKLAQQLEEYEKKHLPKANGIIAITEEDSRYFKENFPEMSVVAIPPSIKSDYPSANYSFSDFYFLGAMDWKPNQEGINWFLQKVIPNGIKGNTFLLAGKGLKKKKKYKHPTVKVVGEVRNALQFINSHGICIIPLQSGSGIKIKLLENMAIGKPIITTSEGVKGVPVTHQKEVLIADTPSEFLAQMEKLQKDSKGREKIGKNAQKFVTRHYSSKIVKNQLIGYLQKI